MRAIGVVGYHNSGKTTLASALARELRDRGCTVAAVKHASERVDLQGKDTARLAEVANPIGFISADQSGILWRGAKRLEDLYPHLKADLLIIEGFKGEKTFPKIACLTGQPQDANLFDGLVICAVGPTPSGLVVHVPVLGLDDIREIADLVIEKAFKLPRLDCKGCGHDTCYELAQEIVRGTRTISDCVSLDPETVVTIDGELLPTNPFISRIIESTIRGALSPLKGYSEGRIEVKIG